MPTMRESTKVNANAPSRSQTGAPSRPQVSTPPYNPGLHQLVEGKQTWAVPLDEAAKAKGFLGWHQRGYLPHYDVPGVTQIVTLRLADSLPASRRGEWEHLLRIENDHASAAEISRSQSGAPPSRSADVRVGLTHGKSMMPENHQPTPANCGSDTQSRSQTGAPLRAAGRARRRKLEEYLDRGLGECWLRQPAIAKLTEDALRYFDGQRYTLAAWVVMPNHVHLLVDVWEVPLAELIKSWKSHVARAANKLLGRSGPFWEREYLDTVIADEKQRQTAVRYIENNPVKAALVRVARQWPWSSARLRDEFGRLRSADFQLAYDAANP